MTVFIALIFLFLFDIISESSLSVLKSASCKCTALIILASFFRYTLCEIVKNGSLCFSIISSWPDVIAYIWRYCAYYLFSELMCIVDVFRYLLSFFNYLF